MDYFETEPAEANQPVSLVELAGSDDAHPTAQEISERGGLPLLVGDRILAEVSNSELHAGLAAARELSDAELSQICGELAARLQDTLSTSEPSGDLVETASDAAALFVLCLQHYGITDQRQIGPCSLQYDVAKCQLQLKKSA
jgi:hypothetical protein